MDDVTRVAAWLEDAASDGLTAASKGDQHNFRVAAAKLREFAAISVQVADRLEAWAETHNNLAQRDHDVERAKVNTFKRDNYMFLAHILRAACRVDSSANSTNAKGAQVASPAVAL